MRKKLTVNVKNREKRINEKDDARIVVVNL